MVVTVSDDLWEADTVALRVFEDRNLIETVAIYSLFSRNQEVGNIRLLSNDTIGLSFAEKNWSFQISPKPRFIIKFLAMFSIGFGFFAVHDKNLTRVSINHLERLSLLGRL